MSKTFLQHAKEATLNESSKLADALSQAGLAPPSAADKAKKAKGHAIAKARYEKELEQKYGANWKEEHAKVMAKQKDDHNKMMDKFSADKKATAERFAKMSDAEKAEYKKKQNDVYAGRRKGSNWTGD